jgi:heat shock protein HslJ
MLRTMSAVLLAGAAIVVGTVVPAQAGDVTSTSGSIVGDWRTSTNGVRQTITFAADGKVFGDAGCNRFTGTYTTDGNEISIGPLATTLIACEGNVGDAEAIFLNKVQAAVSYQATERRLKLFTPKDLMVFRRA